MTRWEWVLLGALLLAVGARFVRLEIDPPYNIISNSGEFLTDEGWYTKSAQLHAKFGEWTSEHDMAWFSHTSLFSLVESVAFSLFGVGVRVARLVSVVASCVSLAAFYLMLRTIQPRAVALATCLIAAIALPCFAYSRMALVEPLGIAASMTALAAWVRLPRGVPACGAGLLLAAAAYFVKVSFIFTFVALVLLSLGEAALLVRDRRRGAALAVLALAALVPAAAAAAQAHVSALAPEQSATFVQWHVKSRVDELSFDSVVYSEAKVAFKLATTTGCLTLFVIGVLGTIALVIRDRHLPGLPRTRTTWALLLWGLGGASFFGLFEYQPPRYLLFAVFPIVFIAVSVVRDLPPRDRWCLRVMLLLAVHAGAQIPGYAAWLGRGSLASADAASRSAVAKMDLTGAEGGVGVIGGTASFLGLYDERIRPLDYRHEDELASRVQRWRPRYLVTFPDAAQFIVINCPGIVERIEEVSPLHYMDNYYTPQDVTLYRIHYLR